MKAYVKRINGLSLAARGDSNHWVVTDAPPNLNGSDAGSRPMELLLMALAGCTAMDVLSILEKMRVKLADFEMEIESERAQQHPKVFTKIHLKYIFHGKNIPSQSVERAIELSQGTYCSISAMLRSTVAITHSYEMREHTTE